MALSKEDNDEQLEFKWGLAGARGKNHLVRFYKSFTFDGTDYEQYDCVYMWTEGAAQPHIGKLVKIWDHNEKFKKVKVQWFFRPSEISYFLKDEKVLKNELFFASGEGVGVANINPLEKNTWFKDPRWEDKMLTGQEQGTLILLQNLDPEYTSGEVEDIIWHAFREKCSAKMVQHTTISSPHCGQAFVILRSKEVAHRVLKRLREDCLMLPNERPLVGGLARLPKVSEKHESFAGHLSIDKLKHKMQKETKEAVSTSHYSQRNTIEYEMAMDWFLLQARSTKWFNKLYKKQGDEMKKLKAKFQSRQSAN